MAIYFVPTPGTVLLCDYGFSGVPPEMTKRRPVVVLSPRRRRTNGTYLVVPLSRSVPRPMEPVHCRIAAGTYAFLDSRIDSWAKCDMVAAVSGERLDRLRFAQRYVAPQISLLDLDRLYAGVLCAFGLAARMPEV